MDDRPLHYQSITQLASMLRSGETTPTALTEHFLSRIENLNGPLNAFNLVTAERAMAEATSAEVLLAAGRDLGPLHGVPYGVKDIYDVAGLPTTAGSQTLNSAPKKEESEVTRRLAAAGMIVLGKTITVEFAKGIVGINHIQGTPHNPWCEEHCVPGGSSAGTAVAVASGMAPMGLGSDTGGSVRVPAGLSGTVGLKSTVGRISRFGVFPLSWTLDSVGPLTRRVEDAALIYQILQGEDPRDKSTLGIRPDEALVSIKAGVKGIRIGIPQHTFFDNVDTEVEQAVMGAAQVFRDLGATVENIPYPEAEAVTKMSSVINGVEAAVIHEERLKTKADLMDPVVGPRMLSEREYLATDYVKMLNELKELQVSQMETLSEVDVVLSPSARIPAMPVTTVDASLAVYLNYAEQYIANSNVGNRLGLCGLSLPCGFTSKGLPIGLLLNGKPFQEAMVLRVGYAYEQATNWKEVYPDLSWAGE
jgi:aspartyl-tRNA(Asn)/glutamyl-tRNA(Gln) amidotransferase subunit A